VSPGDPEWARSLGTAISDAVTILTRYGAHVVIPVLPCIGDIGPVVDNQRYKLDSPARLRDAQAVFSGVLAKHRSQVSTPDLNKFLCPQGKFANRMGSVSVVRSDGVHFTREGADLVANWLVPVIRAAAPNANLTYQGALPLKDALSHRLTKAGFVCPFRNFTDPGDAPVIVDCTKSGKRTRLRIFSRSDTFDRFVTLQNAVGCKYARTAGQGSIRYSLGSQWLLTGDGTALAEAAHALGVPVTTVRC
jgi:hypothetical protein